ncbi:MAG: hypothetical protein RJQ21_19580 [Rhodospirillales bacterium]
MSENEDKVKNLIMRMADFNEKPVDRAVTEAVVNWRGNDPERAGMTTRPGKICIVRGQS